MEIKFIGSGSGKTSLNRCHSSLLLSAKNYCLLVDSGDGISKALLQQNISFNSINGIIISHLHPDHFSGLGTLIVQMKLTGRNNKLDIFIHQSLVNIIKEYLYRSYIFNEKINFIINYIPFIDNEDSILADGFSFIAKQNSHLEPYKVYDGSKTLSFSCCSFLFTSGGKNIFYTGDIGGKENLFLFKDRIIDTMISEVSHISMTDLTMTIRSLAIKKLILTHISDEDDKMLSEFLQNYLPAGKSFDKSDGEFIYIAFDGLSITI